MRKILKISLIIFLMIITLDTISFAEDNISVVDKSEAYEIWENLSEEERENTIQPTFYTLNFKDTVKRSKYYSLISLGNSLEARYDLRKITGNNLRVEDQKQVGACWAFAHTTMLESTMAKKYNKSNQYSPMHIDYKTSQIFNRQVGAGGNDNIALAYGASGYGPVYEEELPFDSVYDEVNNSRESYYLTDINKVNLNYTAKVRVKDAVFFPNIYKTVNENVITYKDSNSFLGSKKYTEEEITGIRNLIKRHIKENGAVTASFYADTYGAVSPQGDYVSNYFDSDNNAYYCEGNSFRQANHAVVIVGWDDNYSKNNFNEENRPINNGAYIILNSWGSTFGDDGYCYVSYDDGYIEQLVCGVNELEETSGNLYDKVYEHDSLGMTLYINPVNDEKTEYLTSSYVANVFTRENLVDEYEYISEIGIFLGTTEGIEIYINSEDDDLNDCELVATYTGSNALETGYHTLELASPVLLTGTKFAIKVKYINSEKCTVPLECNLKESGLSTVEDMSYTAKSNVGESFISKDGINWSDMTNYKYFDYTLKNTNACIKGFTMISNTAREIAVTGVSLNKKNITIEEGKTDTLTATITPENATNKNVTWTSSNEAVAKVSGGVITGIKSGTATITVKTADGGKTDTCTVTVEKSSIVKVEKIELNKKELTMEVGDKTNLVVTFNPVDVTNKNVTWSSSNEKVATIDKNGIITALSEGTTIVTVTSEDGNKKASCTITVKEEVIEDPDNIYKEDGETKKEDNTIADKDIPKAGMKTILCAFVALILLSTYFIIKVKNMKDVK